MRVTYGDGSSKSESDMIKLNMNENMLSDLLLSDPVTVQKLCYLNYVIQTMCPRLKNFI